MRVSLALLVVCALTAIGLQTVPTTKFTELSQAESEHVAGGAGPCKYVAPMSCPLHQGCEAGGCANVAIPGGFRVQCIGGAHTPRTPNAQAGAPLFDNCTGASMGYTQCESDGTTVLCAEERLCKLHPCVLIGNAWKCVDNGPFQPPVNDVRENMIMSGDPCGVA